jgi:predicted nucleotidyltransferase
MVVPKIGLWAIAHHPIRERYIAPCFQSGGIEFSYSHTIDARRTFIRHHLPISPHHTICQRSAYLVNLKKIGYAKALIDNIEKINALCRNHNVRSLFAFGSVVTDSFNDKSDIDLLVSFNPMEHGDYADTYFKLAEIRKMFKRQVDLGRKNL